MKGNLVLVSTLAGHKDRVWHLSWSPDGSKLLTCSGDKTIRIWANSDAKWLCVAVLEEAQSRTIRSCEWSPCGNFIASVSFDATAVIWAKSTQENSEEYEVIASLEGHESEVKSVSWSPNSKLIATCSRDKSIWLWEADPEVEYECISVLHGHTQDVKFVKWHPSQNYLFSASYDNTIKIWAENEDDWYCKDTLTGHTSTVWCISFSQNGDYMASCSDDKTIIVWGIIKNSDNSNTESSFIWKQLYTISGFHERTIFSIDWSSNDYLVVGGGDNSVRVFKLNENSFESINSLSSAHEGDVNCVRWHSCDSTIFASCGDDFFAKLWRLE